MLEIGLDPALPGDIDTRGKDALDLSGAVPEHSIAKGDDPLHAVRRNDPVFNVFGLLGVARPQGLISATWPSISITMTRPLQGRLLLRDIAHAGLEDWSIIQVNAA